MEDKNKILRDVFFPLQYPNENFVLIDVEGNYYVGKGECAKHYIFGILRDRLNITNENSYIEGIEVKRASQIMKVRIVRQ